MCKNTLFHILVVLLLLSVMLAGCAQEDRGLPERSQSLIKGFELLKPENSNWLSEGKVAVRIELEEPLLWESLDRETITVTPPVPWRLYVDNEPWDQRAGGEFSALVVELDVAHLKKADTESIEVNVHDNEVIAANDLARYPMIFKHRFRVPLSGLSMPPIIITKPKQGDLLGLGDLQNGNELHVTFLAEEAGDFVFPSINYPAGGSNLTTLGPFKIMPGGAGGRIDSIIPITIGGIVYHEVQMVMPVFSGIESMVKLQLELYMGETVNSANLGSATVAFTLDLIRPKISPTHTTRNDESDQDQLVNRVCVEVNEEASSIRPYCNDSPVAIQPAGDPDRILMKTDNQIYCIHSLQVSNNCSRLSVEVLDKAGNESLPHDFGNFVCQIPSKYIWQGGRRNTLVIDGDDRTHIAYILENGVYYARLSLDGRWQSEPIHCACGFNSDTGQCKPNDCKKQYGLNVGLSVDEEGTPGVCFIYGDKIGNDEDYTATGELNIRWRKGAKEGQNWPGDIPVKDEARFFHCALHNRGLFGEKDFPGETVIFVEGQKGSTASKLVSQMHDISTGSWIRKEIADFLGREVSMVADSDGRLHIVYRGSKSKKNRKDDFQLNYSRHPKGMTGGGWQTVQIEDEFGMPILGSRPSVDLSPSGHAAISYFDSLLNSASFAQQQAKVDQFSGMEVWENERIFKGESLLEVYYQGKYREMLNPGDLATQDSVYVGASSDLVFDSHNQPRIVFVVEQRTALGSNVIVDVGELIVVTRTLNGVWHYSVLDGRIEGTVDLSAALNSAGRLRILYHNGLHPLDADNNGGYGSLQYWYAESKSTIYAHPDDYIGVNSNPTHDSCAAHLQRRQEEAANRLSEAQINLTFDPATLVSNPDRPTDDDLVELFELLRRYHDTDEFDNFLPPLPPGTGTWDEANTTDPIIRHLLVMPGLFTAFRQEFVRFAANLGIKGGFAARLNPPNNNPLSLTERPPEPIPNPPASLQEDLLDGPLMEDIFADLEIRSNIYSPLVKNQKNVCVPEDCSLQSSLKTSAIPEAVLIPQPAQLVHKMDWLSLDLEEATKDCSSKNAVLVVRANAQELTGCYQCPVPNHVVIGLSIFNHPVCVPGCAGGEEPDYRRVFEYEDEELIGDYPYMNCLDKGCDDTRCPDQKCPHEQFQGPAGQVREDEDWSPVPGRGLCVRCPEGTMQVSCRDAESEKCGSDEYGCNVSKERERCERNGNVCKNDYDCDIAAGFGCIKELGKCYKLKKCTEDKISGSNSCQNLTDNCVNGFCRPELQPCELLIPCPKDMECVTRGLFGPGVCMPVCYGDGSCPADMTCKLSKSPVAMGATTSGHCEWEIEAFDPSALRCQSIGCTTCLNNAYCLNPEVTTDNLWCLDTENCTFCPKGHSCVTQGAEKTAFCLARPFLDDFFVPLMGGFIGEEAEILFNMPDAINNALGDINVPTKIEGYSISFSERIQRGGFRFRGHSLGDHHQGYIVFALEFADDLEIDVSCTSITLSKPFMRIRFQPFSFAELDDTGQIFSGRIYVTPVDMGIFESIDATEPITINRDDINCAGDCLMNLGCASMEDLGKVNPELQKLLEGQLKEQLQDYLNEILNMLIHDIFIGGWLFGRTLAIEELDVARDTVPGMSSRYTGDDNPEDEIQRLLIRPAFGDKPGYGFIDYAER